MNTGTYGQSLARRVLHEHRRAVTLIVAGIVLNVLAYALLVYPLAGRVANVEQRTATAERALLLARQEHGLASGTLTGKARAASELSTFYGDVLPANLSAARSLTHLRLAQLARQSRLRVGSVRYVPSDEVNSTLTRLKTDIELVGAYDDMRAFIHTLETAPEFVVVDNVELAEEAASDNLIVVRLELSTYFRNQSE